MESKIYQKRLLMLLTSACGPVFGLSASGRRWLLSGYLWLSLELCRSVGLARLSPPLFPFFLSPSRFPLSSILSNHSSLFLSLSLPLFSPYFLFPSASLLPLPLPSAFPFSLFLLPPVSSLSSFLPFPPE